MATSSEDDRELHEAKGRGKGARVRQGFQDQAQNFRLCLLRLPRFWPSHQVGIASPSRPQSTSQEDFIPRFVIF